MSSCTQTGKKRSLNEREISKIELVENQNVALKLDVTISISSHELSSDKKVENESIKVSSVKESNDGAMTTLDICENLKDRVLPDVKADVNPKKFLSDLVEALHGYKPKVKPALQLKKYFHEITEERIASYDVAAVTATRTNNLEDVKKLYEEGKRMDCCNRFGESLLHMVCRRGFLDIGIFLLNDANLSVRIMDDCGRNPFHDICWNPTIEVNLATEVLKKDPTLLLLGDKRGHTPFDYARRQDWRVWRDLLIKNYQYLEPLGKPEVRAIFEVA